jgi:hypothetical protein
MEAEQFWQIIDRVNRESGGDMDRKSALLKGELSRRSSDEVLQFARRFDALLDAAYTWPLWGAAYVINGGCSDDSFMDFRSTLISRGRVDFEYALKDPDALADLPGVGEGMFYEGFHYVAAEVFEEKTGGPLPMREEPAPSEPAGEPWEEDDVESLFPRLSAKFSGR